VDYTLRSAPVTADTSGSAGDDGEAGEGDSIASDVEDLFGGAGGDSLTGSAGANVLDGGGGGDTLVGGDAGDTLLGGDGNDSLDGGPGTDQFSADGGDDTILMQDTLTEHAGCGDGTDNVSADRSDIVDLDCEQVTRAARITRTPLPIRPPRTPTTSTPPIVPAVVDTTAPRGTLAISPLRLRRALKIGQRVSVTCDTACSSRIELQLSAKAARRLGLKGSKGPVIVATGVRSAVNSRHYVIVIRFASKLRSRLAKAKTLSLRLHAVFADAADNERSTLRRLVLRR
jgi:hypothetical protein